MNKSNSNAVSHLNIDGMQGRFLRLPCVDSTNSTEILLVYGVHSSIERMYTTAEFLQNYGTVTLPDLPGIGGMDSFYMVGKQPTLDEYADYLYTFIVSQKFKNPIKIVAMSYGFLVVTRMLQKHKLAQQNTGQVISFVGFGSANDFKNIKTQRLWQLPLCQLFSTKLGGAFVKYFIFNKFGLRIMFWIFKQFNPKYKHAMETNPDQSLKMEMDLWQINDARTRFALYSVLFTFDLVRSAKELIKVPLHNMSTPNDQYFDASKVAESLRDLYSNVEDSVANSKLHAPSIIRSKAEAAVIFSAESKRALKVQA